MKFKDTLNLPQTSFPMQAKLPEKEPEILSRWEQENQYEQLQERLADRPLFILHDGPPYANGHLHMGHALNKILKDIINRVAIKNGKKPVYIPGWDCHGLPIEHRVLAELKKNRSELSPVEIRTRCRESAQTFAGIQQEEFRRMGILADWKNPYLTMEYGYEATILRCFARMVQDKRVYKGVKPVLWCPNCETALADAEVEYEEHVSKSATVLFLENGSASERRFFPIWTTTPWTLPANRAVALNPGAEYLELEWVRESPGTLFRKGDRIIVGALLWTTEKGYAGFSAIHEGFSVLSTRKGKDFLDRSPGLRSPINGQTVPLAGGEFVTMDQGTGMVHIAPGHGEDDYHLGKSLNLEIYAPLDNRGRYTQDLEQTLPDLVGMPVQKADPAILDHLSSRGVLVETAEYRHSYPHCWRCKKPVLFRATPQWFLSLSEKNLRSETLSAIASVEWIPSKGENRITGMISTRPDWCLSRQRAWGIPIPAFTCRSCRNSFIDSGFVLRLADWTETHGVDAWFLDPLPDSLLSDLRCPSCKGTDLTPEKDILDVWFDSGVSHVAVLKNREGIRWPADLYLEGSDQHRGWFHSSLLTSMALFNEAPYRRVLTHGFVVDGQGRKMSKSLKNVISPLEIVQKYGAEILRLWTASSDYQEDIRLSEVILSHLVESYRKIRNTFRFLVSNLYDFPLDPSTRAPWIQTPSQDLLDRWILSLWEQTKERIIRAYEEFDFGQVTHLANQFCSVSLSAHYFDMVKDRLYTERKDAPERRFTQATMWAIGQELLLCLEPILVFTSEELASHLPSGHPTSGPQESRAFDLHASPFPSSVQSRIDPLLEEKMDQLLALRGEFGKIMDELKKTKIVGSALEVEVTLTGRSVHDGVFEGLTDSFLATFLIVAGVSRQIEPEPSVRLEEGRKILAEQHSETVSGVRWTLTTARGKKCERCWIFSPTTGNNKEGWNICSRCHPIVLEWTRNHPAPDMQTENA
ncbi:MAG: isoleucine--tRNA ligase [Leptospirales bacterium]